ncbi:MAG: hypothetical protein K8S00_05700 [Bacteroidales bacterium]|nr:hypothetical protein [Bacteroidales bacterium]
MKKIVFFVSAFIIILANPTSSNASDFIFMPRVMGGVETYNYEQEAPGGNTLEFSDTMPFIGCGVTVAKDSFYIDGYFMETETGSDSPYNWDVNFSRQNYSFSVGYHKEGSLGTYFVGYRSGKTEFETATEFDLTTSGWFVGGAIGNPYFSFNCAIAFLEGDATDEQDNVVGFTAGVKWKTPVKPITERLYFGLSIDYSLFSFENFTESTINYGASLSYVF